MRRSVLRVSDQHAGRLPDVCVLSGAPTANAVRVRAVALRGPRWLLHVPGLALIGWRILGRPSSMLVLPVCGDVWTRWRRRVTAGQAAVTFGIVLVAAALAGGGLPPGAVGVVVTVVGWVLWARANRNWWVTCRYDPADSVIVVEPAHPRFDDEARALFTRSIR